MGSNLKKVCGGGEMLTRNERNKLELNILDVQIFLDDLFAECENEDEIEWLQNELMEYVDIASEQRKDEVEE